MTTTIEQFRHENHRSIFERASATLLPLGRSIELAEESPGLSGGVVVCERARTSVIRYLRAWQRQEGGVISEREVKDLGLSLLDLLLHAIAAVSRCAREVTDVDGKNYLERYANNKFHVNVMKCLTGPGSINERLQECGRLMESDMALRLRGVAGESARIAMGAHSRQQRHTLTKSGLEGWYG